MKEEVYKALEVLKKGGIILYPTDTVWGIGCDAGNFEAVKKIYALKQREETKFMICLVSGLQMLEKHVSEVPQMAYELMDYAVKPTTIIYDAPFNVAENLIAEDNSLAIRVTEDEFCRSLIRKLHRPLVSTSANLSGEKTPMNFEEISDVILKGVDYVVNLHRDKKGANPSAIIKLKNDGSVKVIRE